MAQCKRFSIAQLLIELQTEKKLKISESFREFEVTEEVVQTPDYRICFESTDQLPSVDGASVFENFRFRILRMQDGSYSRMFLEESNGQKPYAISFFQDREIRVFYLKDKETYFKDVQKAFLHIAWEWILMKERMMILHASYVETVIGTLAFSGPSGIGKSTQADLWCRYEQGRMLNGDKVILKKDHGSWTGYGSPYAGSSKCYVNAGSSLSYLIFLKQGKTCSLRPLPPSESFRRIYEGLTVNYWDKEFVEVMCDLAQQMAFEIPAYEWICTPDQEAVRSLKEKLSAGGEYDGS